jgi:hypothetical protein
MVGVRGIADELELLKCVLKSDTGISLQDNFSDVFQINLLQ